VDGRERGRRDEGREDLGVIPFVSYAACGFPLPPSLPPPLPPSLPPMPAPRRTDARRLPRHRRELGPSFLSPRSPALPPPQVHPPARLRHLWGPLSGSESQVRGREGGREGGREEGQGEKAEGLQGGKKDAFPHRNFTKSVFSSHPPPPTHPPPPPPRPPPPPPPR
jgi:hypothetical protein